MLYCRLIYMLSILCVRLSIKVKVGISENLENWFNFDGLITDKKIIWVLRFPQCHCLSFSSVYLQVIRSEPEG